MRLGVRDIINCIGKVDAIAITTNGFVKRDGSAVMGRGLAKAMADRFPRLPRILGSKLYQYGNGIYTLMEVQGTTIINFPVKGEYIIFFWK